MILTHIPRPPLYTRRNPDSGSLEVVRGYRDTSTPEGKYTPRTWTKAPPEQHTVTYEGTRYGYRRCQTMVHNPRTGLFELKHSPIASPTVSPEQRLRGTAHATNKHSPLTGTASQITHSTVNPIKAPMPNPLKLLIATLALRPKTYKLLSGLKYGPLLIHFSP